MPRLLTEAQVAGFRRDGFVFPMTAFDAAEAKACRDCLEAYERDTGQHAQESLTLKSHLPFRRFCALIRNDNILDAVEDLIGPDILCWGSSFFVKDPGDGRFVSWHADTYYYGIEPRETVTAWVAFTPANEVTGCIRCIPGSHLTPSAFENVKQANNILKRGQTTKNVDESKAVTMPLAPGQFSIHQECTVHGSEPNRSDDRRIGYSIHYCPTHARQTKYSAADGRPSAALVRGVDAFNYWDHEPMTQVAYDPAIAARMLDIRRQFLSRG
jgi:ectoine hydroxylase-related dioxygenase (phytanoyl-CoA dioxygenase family)